MRNCDASGYAAFHVSAAPELDRCPWADLDNDVWAAVTWWLDWRDLHILPFGGSDLMAQPAYVLEAIRTCQDALHRIESAQRRREAEEAQRLRDKMARR